MVDKSCRLCKHIPIGNYLNHCASCNSKSNFEPIEGKETKTKSKSRKSFESPRCNSLEPCIIKNCSLCEHYKFNKDLEKDIIQKLQKETAKVSDLELFKRILEEGIDEKEKLQIIKNIKIRIAAQNKNGRTYKSEFNSKWLELNNTEGPIISPYIFITKKEVLMNNVKEIKSLESVMYIIPASGHSKETITFKSERNSEATVNNIHIIKKNPKFDKKILESIEFEGDYCISVENTYNVKNSVITIHDGLIIIEVPVDAGRIEIINVK